MNLRRQFLRLLAPVNQHKEYLRSLREIFVNIFNTAIPLLLLIAIALVIYDFGFKPFWRQSKLVNIWIRVILDILVVLMGFRILLNLVIPQKRRVRIFTLAGWVFILLLAFYVLPEQSTITNFSTNKFIAYKLFLYGGILLAFITEASSFLKYVYNKAVNAALLFVGSFALLIVIGTFLLKLPNATNHKISMLDALFTATSAVCVTGLTVVDTGTQFTTFGHLILLLLIQAGGLGIMTFAGLLAYAVAGQTSLKTELAFKELMSGKQMGNIMRFISQVVLVTLFFELIGAVGIYISLPDNLFDRKLDKVFFSIFHSVSAFCNAGFSTYSSGLYEPLIRFNYALQFFIAVLIILGGLGFPIVFNLFRYLKVRAINRFRSLIGVSKREYFPKLININSRLALVMTVFLLGLGFIAYFFFEQSHSLRQHPTVIGKIWTSFFGGVTPRTAGFNTVDLTALSLPMIMIYLLLMWIGASPGSTGGGIRTTTAGVALLNMAAVLRGKDRSEFFKSEISHHSVRRAFAIILLSLLFIGFSIFLITINDSDKGLIKIAFEVFSAFSTVGLTLGITPNLTVSSKLVIIFTMFTGRVGMITLLVAFIRQSKPLYYRFPKEEIAF